MFVRNVLPPTAALMADVYADHKDEDGFLYITVGGRAGGKGGGSSCGRRLGGGWVGGWAGGRSPQGRALSFLDITVGAGSSGISCLGGWVGWFGGWRPHGRWGADVLT